MRAGADARPSEEPHEVRERVLPLRLRLSVRGRRLRLRLHGLHGLHGMSGAWICLRVRSRKDPLWLGMAGASVLPAR